MAQPADMDFAHITAAVGEACFRWNIRSRVIAWSANVADVLGGLPAEARCDATAFATFMDASGREQRDNAVLRATTRDFGDGVPYQLEYALTVEGQSPVWIEETGRWYAGEDEKPAWAEGVLRVVTPRHERVDHLTRLAYCDPLTGGLNRGMLIEALDEALDDANRFRASFGFLVVGVDHLARLNDAFGFAVADEVIGAIGQRIRARLRGGDVLGRLSGNKLGIILKRCKMEEMKVAAERFLACVRESAVPTSVGAAVVTASIGGIIAPRHARNASEIVSRAQEALDIAKRRRHGSFRCWLPNVERDAQRSASIRVTDEIITALNDRSIVLAFEPVAPIRTRTPHFYECLVRMRSEGGILRMANDVVPIAEKLGLIRLIDQRVLELVLEHLVADPKLHLSLNISPDTTADPDWWNSLDGLLRANPGVAERLIVEITETAAIQDIDDVRGFVARLRDRGTRIAIDDFGAGYTSFRNLRKLGVDIVKIDGAFVQNIVHSQDDRAFVHTLLDLAKRLGIKTVAEWVQDEAAEQLLAEWGCDFIQGHLLGLATTESPGAKNAAPSISAAAPMAQLAG